MEEKLNQLKTILAEINDYALANGLLGYDRQTQMPPGGIESRANVQAALSQLTQEKATSDELGICGA